MRIRIRMTPDKDWVVESKRWYNFGWRFERFFMGDDAYNRALFYARALQHPTFEEIT
jgi:hypothetical protein